MSSAMQLVLLLPAFLADPCSGPACSRPARSSPCAWMAVSSSTNALARSAFVDDLVLIADQRLEAIRRTAWGVRADARLRARLALRELRTAVGGFGQRVAVILSPAPRDRVPLSLVCVGGACRSWRRSPDRRFVTAAHPRHRSCPRRDPAGVDRVFASAVRWRVSRTQADGQRSRGHDVLVQLSAREPQHRGEISRRVGDARRLPRVPVRRRRRATQTHRCARDGHRAALRAACCRFRPAGRGWR